MESPSLNLQIWKKRKKKEIIVEYAINHFQSEKTFMNQNFTWLIILI